MTKSIKPRLQIIRGLPGSGKTTLALKQYPHLMRIETDMVFYRRAAYRFTMELNEEAVKWFKLQIDTNTRRQMDFVTTGVFAGHTERLEGTIKKALSRGYEVWIKTMNNDFGDIHKVPEAHKNSMRDAFVPEKELKALYKDNPDVHFGLMPAGDKVGRE